MRSRWVFLFALVAGLGLFAAIWIAASRNGSEPIAGGIYIEGIAGEPDRINPLFAGFNEVDESLVSLIFAGLTRLDEHGRPSPDLAESWTVSPDGLTYIFTLRSGLLWQDGIPLTAEDVEFTYELLGAQGVNPSSTIASVLDQAKISILDIRTIQIRLDQPFAPLPAYLTLGILPVRILSDVGPQGISEAVFNRAPIGAGPYRLKALDQTRAVLVPNLFYHIALPLLEEIELRFFRNEVDLLAALKAQQIDGAMFSSGLGDADLLDLDRAGFNTLHLPTTETVFVFLNLTEPNFDDLRVRQALLHALDLDAIISGLHGSLAIRADSPLPPAIWSSTPSLQKYGYDLQAAESLLEEVGWVLVEEVRQRGGVSLSFQLVTDSDPVRVAVAQEVVKSWQALGIEVTLESVGSTKLVRDLLEPRRFEALLFALTGGPDPDPYSTWHRSAISAEGDNLAMLTNITIDALLEEGRAALSLDRREELYIEFQELFAEGVPSIPIYTSSMIYVQTSSLGGVRIGFMQNAGARFGQAHEWYLETR